MQQFHECIWYEGCGRHEADVGDDPFKYCVQIVAITLIPDTPGKNCTQAKSYLHMIVLGHKFVPDKP